LQPNENAVGDHSTIKTDPKTGKTTNYSTYTKNAKNPSGFQEVKRVDVKGAAHGNIETPHVHEAGSKQVMGRLQKHTMFFLRFFALGIVAEILLWSLRNKRLKRIARPAFSAGNAPIKMLDFGGYLINNCVCICFIIKPHGIVSAFKPCHLALGKTTGVFLYFFDGKI
jgi:Bacterial toxin 24